MPPLRSSYQHSASPATRSAALSRWLVVGTYLVVTFVTLPYIPVWRDWLIEQVGLQQLGTGVGMVLIGIGVAWLGYALFRRKPPLTSYICLALIAVAYAYSFNQLTIIIEKVHFIQYGFLGLLVYRALKSHVHDGWIYLQAVLIVFLAALCDEFLQWAIPVRTGDLRDVGLDTLAGGFTLLFMATVVRPELGGWRPTRGASRAMVAETGAGLLVLALFLVQISEFGYRIEDPYIGIFYSGFPKEVLLSKSQAYLDQPDSTAYWVAFTETVFDQGPQDLYFDEAYVHRFRRDRYFFRHKDYFVAYKEHLILSRYFAPYLAHLGPYSRWTPASLTVCLDALGERIREPYESAVRAHLIVRFSKQTMWIAVAVGLILVGAALFRLRE